MKFEKFVKFTAKKLDTIFHFLKFNSIYIYIYICVCVCVYIYIYKEIILIELHA